jgi:uncharacterized protein YaiI (UPF0178 family)
MKILVDADSCPVQTRDIIVRAAQRTDIKAVFAANRLIPGIDAENTIMELCPEGSGAADDRIVALAEHGDIAVTRDVPLAARLVEKGVVALDDRGRIFTKDNIRGFLSLRDFQVGLANNGAQIVRISNYDKKDLKAFADSFDRLLTKAMQSV